MYSQAKFTSWIMIALSVVLFVCVVGLSGCKRAAHFPTKDASFVAVRENDRAALENLLDEGTNVNKTSEDGNSLIYTATGPKGGLAVLELLIARGADVSLGSKKGRSPLMNAAGWCSVDAVALLLAAGADANYVAPSGDNAAEATCSAPTDLRRETLNLLFGS